MRRLTVYLCTVKPSDILKVPYSTSVHRQQCPQSFVKVTTTTLCVQMHTVDKPLQNKQTLLSVSGEEAAHCA